MITTFNDVVDFIGGNLSDDDQMNIKTIHSMIEKYVSRYCRRTFESTTYTLEKYNGTGSNFLFLRNYPVTALERLAIGTQDVIRIKNTSAQTTASVSVTGTLVRLVKDGVANETTTFASYTTMNAVVTQINTIGSGWSASLDSSLYGSFKSTDLIEKFGLNAIDSNWVYLEMPDPDAEYNFEVHPNRGQISLTREASRKVFPPGFQNVFVTYTAGYTSSNMPDDLVAAVQIAVKNFYQRTKNQAEGLSSYRIGDLSFTFANVDSKNYIEKTLPAESRAIFDSYKRRLV